MSLPFGASSTAFRYSSAARSKSRSDPWGSGSLGAFEHRSPAVHLLGQLGAAPAVEQAVEGAHGVTDD